MRTREKMEETGCRILNQTKTELYLSMHFLGAALGSLDFKLDLSTRTIGTDAASIRFNALWLLQQYVERPEQMNRTYMHMLMHCIFRHMFRAKEHADGELWDLCCDIAAESVIDSMDEPLLLRVTNDFRQAWYDRLTGEVSVLTAEKLYHYFMTHKRDPFAEALLQREFTLCDHSFWERLKTEDDPPPKDETQALPIPLAQLDEQWEKNARRMESELEICARDAAPDTGSLSWILCMENRRRRSYKDFLKRFAVLREEIAVDLDSFDYGLYMHGLSLYGNMPLIEENEFREERRVEELVIAIDTSASCKQKLVQQFLNETAAILAHTESFFHRVKIRILECDNQIQRDIAIAELDELRNYAGHMEVSGGYGTDFRPVFAYVEQLIKSGGIGNLRGLMYFTDGAGEYPKTPTPYETVFVFYGDAADEKSRVPDWAIKLYLEEEESMPPERGGVKEAQGKTAKRGDAAKAEV